MKSDKYFTVFFLFLLFLSSCVNHITIDTIKTHCTPGSIALYTALTDEFAIHANSIIATTCQNSATMETFPVAHAPLSVIEIQPNFGPETGGTMVTIRGNGFLGVSAVNFGSIPAASFKFIDNTTISAISPAGVGVVDVTVTTPKGTSPLSSADQFIYVKTPTVTSVNPNSGSPAGGATVTITGTDFNGASSVLFGSNAASFTLVSNTQITATSPAGNGTVDVRVTTPEGTSPITAADLFTYLAPLVSNVNPHGGPPAGGTPVTISGANFTGTTAVNFGSTPATSFTFINDSTIMATSPAGTGTVDVTVTTPNGTSPITAADQFAYTLTPIVSKVDPNGGTMNDIVTISGSNFTGVSAVTFGSTPAITFTFINDSTITAEVPAGSGLVDVRVTTPAGTSATTANDQFVYVA